MPLCFRRSDLVSCALLICCGALLLGAAAPSADQPLGRDPNNLYGQFDNGMKYIVRKNANPPGKVSLDLHVRTGALNETDQQNGLAHFIEHMAFKGSEHFKPGELIQLMNKMGMVFGAVLYAVATVAVVAAAVPRARRASVLVGVFGRLRRFGSRVRVHPHAA